MDILWKSFSIHKLMQDFEPEISTFVQGVIILQTNNAPNFVLVPSRSIWLACNYDLPKGAPFPEDRLYVMYRRVSVIVIGSPSSIFAKVMEDQPLPFLKGMPLPENPSELFIFPNKYSHLVKQKYMDPISIRNNVNIITWWSSLDAKRERAADIINRAFQSL